MKILIADDSFLVRQILTDTLAPLAQCDIAVDGTEVIQAFTHALKKKPPYDLICMDVKMPHLDGNEALRRVRVIEQENGISPRDEVKVIMITGCDDPKTVVEAYYRGGATSYLTKPFDETTLLEEIKKLGFAP